MRIEWLKLKRSRMFRWAFLSFFVLFPLLIYTVKATQVGSLNQQQMVNSIVAVHFKFPKMWSTCAYWASWLIFLIIPFITAWFICHEFPLRTARQNIINGLKPKQYFTGKVTYIVLFCLVYVVFTAIITLIFGSFEPSFSGPFNKWFVPIFGLFTQSVLYASMVLFLSIATKRSGLSLILFFSYTLIVERILYYMFFVTTIGRSDIGNFLPASIGWFCQPFYLIQSNALGAMEDIGNNNVYFMEQTHAIIVAWCYIIVFSFLSLKRFLRRDH